jgi:hypothetical protein
MLASVNILVKLIYRRNIQKKSTFSVGVGKIQFSVGGGQCKLQEK